MFWRGRSRKFLGKLSVVPDANIAIGFLRGEAVQDTVTMTSLKDLAGVLEHPSS